MFPFSLTLRLKTIFVSDSLPLAFQSCIILYLEVDINAVESLGVLGKLVTNVFRPNEDALQVRPRTLHLEPNRDHGI